MYLTGKFFFLVVHFVAKEMSHVTVFDFRVGQFDGFLVIDDGLVNCLFIADVDGDEIMMDNFRSLCIHCRLLCIH